MRESSVSVYVQSNSSPVTRQYRINNGYWYTFNNNASFSQVGYYEIYTENLTDYYEASFTILPTLGVN